jgi:hypothetical protein
MIVDGLRLSDILKAFLFVTKTAICPGYAKACIPALYEEETACREIGAS